MSRRSKSICKEVSRGFEDEVKDYTLQPLRSLNLFDELVKKLKDDNEPPIELSDGLKKNSGLPKKYSWRHGLSAEQISLVQQSSEKQSNYPYFNSNMIKEFAEGLRGDSLECYEHMHDIRYLFNKQVLSHYNKIYRELKTIPLVFLSIVKTEEKRISTIYLWQFNECCPIELHPTKIAVDCTFNQRQIFAPHNSILLLAKFTTTDQEELLDGQFLSDSRIVVKSRLSNSHTRFREYDMKDLADIVTINPYDARSDLARFHCASKLDISLEENGEMMSCDLSRIRRLMEIELLEYAGVDTISMFIKTDSQKITLADDEISHDNLFNEVYSDEKSSSIVLVDRSLLKAILFKKDSLKVIDLKDFGRIQSIFQNNSQLYFLNEEGKVLRITPSLCDSEKWYQDLNIKIPMSEAQDIKFFKDEDVQYLVYLIGSKFYATMLEIKGTNEYLFDAEELEKGKHADKPQAKFAWEIVEDKIVVIKGIYVHVYDLTEQRFTKRELQSTELLEYEWELLAEKNKLFGISQSKYEEGFRIKAIALKETEIKASEKLFKDSNIFVTCLVANLKKTEESLYVKLTGPHNNILFLRLQEPYLIDNVNRVTNMPNYLFADFVFPAKRHTPATSNNYWHNYQMRQEQERKLKEKEEFNKKVEREEQEFVEYTEMKTKVEKFKKKTEKKDEERKEQMHELRKAIVTAGKEEGADKHDKRLKDVKEEYMSMYQDLKKEKKKEIKEKQKDQLKDRKNARSNKHDF